MRPTRWISLLLTLPLLGTPQAHAVPVLPPLYIATASGSMPYALAAGDLNGDGVKDVVVSNYTASSVSVLISTGKMGFLPKVDYSTPSEPSDVALGDFNNDGRLDLAVTAFGTNQLSVRLGNGNGTFGPRTEYLSHGDNPRGLAVGDLNRDGRLDIVVANITTGSISAFLGNGAGGFPTRIDRGVPGGPVAVAIGDYDLDGIPDLAVTQYFVGTVQLLSGTGTGTFLEYATVTVQGSPIGIVMTDLDRNGKLDVVTANLGTNSISVFPINPPGAGSATHYAAGSVPNDLMVDLDTHDETRLYIPNRGSSSVRVAVFNTAGVYQYAWEYTTGIDPSAIVAFDADGDGDADIATANQGTNDVGLLMMGDPGYHVWSEIPNYAQALRVAAADLNGDGHVDMVAAGLFDSALKVWFGNGDGTFNLSSVAPLPNGSTAGRIDFADVNLDGRMDMAVGTAGFGNTVSFFYGNGNGTFGGRLDFAAPGGTFAVKFADLNLDGRADLITTSPGGAYAFSVFMNNGSGGFLARADYPADYSVGDIAVGRFDADLYPDVAIANGYGNVWLYPGSSTGALGAHVEFPVAFQPRGIAMGDLNGDGKLDIATSNPGDISVTVLLGNGTGGIASQTNYTAGVGHELGIADMNLDGRPDLVGVDCVLYGNGQGQFFNRSFFEYAIYTQDIHLGDFNGDGRLDWATASFHQNSEFVHLGSSPTRITLGTPPPALAGQTVALIANLTWTGSVAPTGQVRFFDGTNLLGTADVANGVANILYTATVKGDRNLTAVYVGNGRHYGSVSNVVTHRVATTAAADIAGILDVKNDQGRNVRLTFIASPYDYLGSGTPITSYSVYRQIVPGLAAEAARGARAAATRVVAPPSSPDAVAILGWDFIGSVPANGELGYELVVPTLADSNGSGVNDATFFVRAATASPTVFSDSPPATGHSVDNLPPAPPGAFVGLYAANVTHLHWAPNEEPDFWYYTLHRGSSAGFTPGPGNVVGTPPDTGYAAAGPAGGYFKLAAVDVNGNVSGYTLLTPQGTVSVGDDPGISFALEGTVPNPARGGRMSVAFTLSSASAASLEVLDVTGRRVVSHDVGTLGAGRHVVELVRGERLRTGVYLVRLTQGGETKTRRTTVLD